MHGAPLNRWQGGNSSFEQEQPGFVTVAGLRGDEHESV